MDAPQLAQNEVDTVAWPDGVFALIHELWGDAKAGTPYDRRQKAKWHCLVQSLREQQLTHESYTEVVRAARVLGVFAADASGRK